MLHVFLSVLNKTSRIINKLLLIVIIYTAIVAVFFHFISKAKPQVNENYNEQSSKIIYQTLQDPTLQKSKNGKIGILLIKMTTCTVLGTACTDNPADDEKRFDKSIIGSMTNLIIMPFQNPPASGVYWAYSGLQESGFIPKTYAAEGIGYAALSPFKGLWMVFRNFVMLLMVLVIVTIGFMIMFRAKLNPQTVISLENSLPRIVIALILITFSYAIAGFLIDMMYVAIMFIIVLLSNNTIIHIDPKEGINKFFNENGLAWLESPWGVFGFGEMWRLGESMLSILGYQIKFLLSTLSALIITKFFLPKLLENLTDPGSYTIFGISLFGLAIGSFVWFAIFLAAMAFGTTFIVTVILLFSYVFILFRIFFMLLATYINTLLLIIFSPVILAFEAIPGKNSFSSWIKNLIMNLMTFPLIVLFMYLARIITYLPVTETSRMWTPPLLTTIDPAAFKTLIAGALFFMIPDLVKSIKQLSGIKPLPIELGIGSFFSGGQAGVGGAVGMLGQFGSINLGISALTGGKGVREVLSGKPAEPRKTVAQATSNTGTNMSATQNADGGGI